MKFLNREEVISLGFKEIPHFTILHNLIYDLGRNRELSIGGLGSCNETIFICETELIEQKEKRITDLVCIHNYDYDGPITLEKLQSLIKVLT